MHSRATACVTAAAEIVLMLFSFRFCKVSVE
jgi:hypothetical protein